MSQKSYIAAVAPLLLFAGLVQAETISITGKYRLWKTADDKHQVMARIMSYDTETRRVTIERQDNEECKTFSRGILCTVDQNYLNRVIPVTTPANAPLEPVPPTDRSKKLISSNDYTKLISKYQAAVLAGVNDLQIKNLRQQVIDLIETLPGQRLAQATEVMQVVTPKEDGPSYVLLASSFVHREKGQQKPKNSHVQYFLARRQDYCSRPIMRHPLASKIPIAESWVVDPQRREAGVRNPVSLQVGAEITEEKATTLRRKTRIEFIATIVDAQLLDQKDHRVVVGKNFKYVKRYGGPTLLVTLNDLEVYAIDRKPVNEPEGLLDQQTNGQPKRHPKYPALIEVENGQPSRPPTGNTSGQQSDNYPPNNQQQP